MKLKTPLLQLN